MAKVSGTSADVVDVELDAELAEIAGLLEFLADERRREDDDEPLAIVLPFRRASDRDVRRRSGGAAG